MLTLWLLACGDPISNQLFYEDSLMVAALPSEARVGPPREVRVARVGDSALLAHAVEQAALLGDLTEVAARSGDALRAADPDQRTDVGRSWDTVQAAGDVAGQRVAWWVRGEVLQPDGASDLSWSIEIAASSDGPWTPVAEGAHDPDGDGAFLWRLGPSLDVLGLDGADAPGDLEVTYDVVDDVRVAEVHYVDGLETEGPWSVVGDQVLAWEGQLELEADDEGQPVPLPGGAQVFASDDGGWGLGYLLDGADALELDTCWGPTGDREYEGGDVDPTGSASDCTLANPF